MSCRKQLRQQTLGPIGSLAGWLSSDWAVAVFAYLVAIAINPVATANPEVALLQFHTLAEGITWPLAEVMVVTTTLQQPLLAVQL